MRGISRPTPIALPALLILIASCTGPARVSEDQRPELAGTLAQVFVDAGSHEQMLDEGADLALDYSIDALKLELGRELTEDEAARVRQILHDVLGEFVTEAGLGQLLTEVCEESFTAAELQAYIEFFRSPAGARFLEIQPEVSAEIDERVLVALRSSSDAFADRVDEELANEFPALAGGTTEP